MSVFENLSIAALGGILPALFWLWFWLHEDNLHPEPKKRLLICFLAGMLSVPLVFPFQKIARDYFGSDSSMTFFLWALTEEVFKFGAAYIAAIIYKDNDEPIDVVIYMITAALGFSAIENIFFLLTSLGSDTYLHAFITGNLRFIGASMLHIVSSAVVGISIAFVYYKPRHYKILALFWGLFFAVGLHTLFNLSIINTESAHSVLAFYSVWIGAVVVLLMFEKVKYITNPLL